MIYKKLIKKAAEKKKAQIQKNLEEFCSLKNDDHEKRRMIFYMTSSYHNELNQMAGLPEIPKELLEQIDAYSNEDFLAIGLGVGAFALGAIAIAAGLGACLLGPIVILALAGSAFLMQAWLFAIEFNRKSRQDNYEALVKRSEITGQAKSGSAEEVSYSWIYVALEGLFFIPIAGITFNGVSKGSKMLSKAAQSFKKNIKKMPRKENFSQVRNVTRLTQEAFDINYAARVVRYKELSKEGSKLSMKGTPDQIRKHLAKDYANYWNNDALEFKKFLQSYTKKTNKAWIRTSRHLKKKSAQIDKLKQELKGVSSGNGSLENFFHKNMDDILDFFEKVPTRVREFPYMFAFLGGPHIGGFVKGSRVRFLYELSDSVMMRKRANAGSRLLYEAYRSQARETLGLSREISNNIGKSFRGLNKTIFQKAEKMKLKKKSIFFK